MIDENIYKEEKEHDTLGWIIYAYKAIIGLSEIRSKILSKCLHKRLIKKIREISPKRAYTEYYFIDNKKMKLIYHLGVVNSEEYGIRAYEKRISTGLLKLKNDLKKQFSDYRIKITATLLEPAQSGEASHYTIMVYDIDNNKITLFNSAFVEWAPSIHIFLQEFAESQNIKFEEEMPECQIDLSYCQTWSLLWLQSHLCDENTLRKFRMKKQQKLDFIINGIINIIEKYPKDFSAKKLNEAIQLDGYNYEIPEDLDIVNYLKYVRDHHKRDFYENPEEDIAELFGKYSTINYRNRDMINMITNNLNLNRSPVLKRARTLGGGKKKKK